MDENKAHRVSTVLKALLHGQEIRMQGRRYSLQETDSGALHLCFEGTRTRAGQPPEPVLLTAPESLSYFIKIASAMSEDEWTEVWFSEAMTKIRKKKNPWPDSKSRTTT